MNRILFEPEELLTDGTVMLSDGRAAHIRQVLGASPGQLLRTGVINGLSGNSCVREVGEDGVRLMPAHTERMPEPWADLLLAAPRPKVLKRLWPQLAALGIGRIVVLNAFKVEKCYFSSQWLEERYYRPLLVEGLAQAGLTRLPEVLIRPRFKPFVEDELDLLFPGTLRLLAHPGPCSVVPEAGEKRLRPLFAVGPEGGWTDYELRMLQARGFRLFSLGERTLRTDTACVALISVVSWWMTPGGGGCNFTSLHRTQKSEFRSQESELIPNDLHKRMPPHAVSPDAET
jgi:RsmE family RNA methyltransferase